MAENIFNWQYNTIPGNANQGAILMTRNDIGQPPFNQSDFIWKAMEDIIGVANVKFKYDEIENKYHIFKATGHRDNNGNWTYNWEEFGSWDALPDEVVETLRMLKYVEYIFDTSIPNVLKVSGKKKDGTVDLLTNISFASPQYVDEKVLDLIKDNLITALNKTWSIDKIKSYIDTIGHFNYKGAINNKNTLPTVAEKGDVYKINKENDLYVNISSTNASNFVPFTDIADAFTTYAIELHKSNNGLYAKLRYDTIDFMIDNAYNLKSILIDDTLDAGDPYANRKTYSIDKILSLLSSSMRYKGQVNYYDLLPTTGNEVGDTWNVKYEGPSSGGSTELDGDNYAWNGTSWDDLSGEYRAGVGIVIQGKTISCTGINFRVGSGLKITGSGDNAILETRNGDGLEYQNVGTTANPIYANKIKTHNGIIVDNNGVSAKLGSGLQFDSNGNIETINPSRYSGSTTYEDQFQTIDSQAGVPFAILATHTFTQQEIDNAKDAMLVVIPFIKECTTLRYHRFSVELNNKIIFIDYTNRIANASDNISTEERVQMLFPINYLKAGDVLTLSVAGITVTNNRGVQVRARILAR